MGLKLPKRGSQLLCILSQQLYQNVLLPHSFHLRQLDGLVLWGQGDGGTFYCTQKEDLLFHSENRGPRNRGEGRTWDLKFKLNLWHHRSQLSPWAKKALSHNPGVIGIHHKSRLSRKGKKKTCFEMTLKPTLNPELGISPTQQSNTQVFENLVVVDFPKVLSEQPVSMLSLWPWICWAL